LDREAEVVNLQSPFGADRQSAFTAEADVTDGRGSGDRGWGNNGQHELEGRYIALLFSLSPPAETEAEQTAVTKSNHLCLN